MSSSGKDTYDADWPRVPSLGLAWALRSDAMAWQISRRTKLIPVDAASKPLVVAEVCSLAPLQTTRCLNTFNTAYYNTHHIITKKVIIIIINKGDLKCIIIIMYIKLSFIFISSVYYYYINYYYIFTIYLLIIIYHSCAHRNQRLFYSKQSTTTFLGIWESSRSWYRPPARKQQGVTRVAVCAAAWEIINQINKCSKII